MDRKGIAEQLLNERRSKVQRSIAGDGKRPGIQAAAAAREAKRDARIADRRGGQLAMEHYVMASELAQQQKDWEEQAARQHLADAEIASKIEEMEQQAAQEDLEDEGLLQYLELREKKQRELEQMLRESWNSTQR